MCNKNASTIETKVWGVIHKRRQQEWGEAVAYQGGGGKFQLLLGYRRSHKGKFMFPKKSRQKYLWGWGKKKISAPGIKWGRQI